MDSTDPYQALLNMQSNINIQLQDMTANPKPDYGIGGQSVSWSSHFNNLMAALENINKRIAESTPTEIRSVSL